MVNSRTGSASCPWRIISPEAPVEKSPETGFTPEWRPCTIWMRTPSSTSATSSAWVRVPGTSERARQPQPGVDLKPPLVALPVGAVPLRRAL